MGETLRISHNVFEKAERDKDRKEKLKKFEDWQKVKKEKGEKLRRMQSKIRDARRLSNQNLPQVNDNSNENNLESEEGGANSKTPTMSNVVSELPPKAEPEDVETICQNSSPEKGRGMGGRTAEKMTEQKRASTRRERTSSKDGGGGVEKAEEDRDKKSSKCSIM